MTDGSNLVTSHDRNRVRLDGLLELVNYSMRATPPSAVLSRTPGCRLLHIEPNISRRPDDCVAAMPSAHAICARSAEQLACRCRRAKHASSAGYMPANVVMLGKHERPTRHSASTPTTKACTRSAPLMPPSIRPAPAAPDTPAHWDEWHAHECRRNQNTWELTPLTSAACRMSTRSLRPRMPAALVRRTAIPRQHVSMVSWRDAPIATAGPVEQRARRLMSYRHRNIPGLSTARCSGPASG